MSFYDQRPIRLEQGIWILENSTHVSEWVKETGRLDHDQFLIPIICGLIKTGDVVIDGGAAIGDHTVAYLRAVGKTGYVVAFEPNPRAFCCLIFNTLLSRSITPVCAALSDFNGVGHMDIGNNSGAAQAEVGRPHVGTIPIALTKLDDYGFPRVDLIKLDVEGGEVRALTGAVETIRRCRPKLVLEVNASQLRRMGHSRQDLFNLIASFGYDFLPVNSDTDVASAPQFDIIALPK